MEFPLYPLNLRPSYEKLKKNEKTLRTNEYAGRAIAIGRGAGKIIIVSVLTGRKETSRSRAFEEISNGYNVVPTKPPQDLDLGETNPNLVYYQGSRSENGLHVVTNGEHTNHIFDAIEANKRISLKAAINSAPKPRDGIDLSSYEPDLHGTPRIGGVVDTRENAANVLGFFSVSRNAASKRVMSSRKGNEQPNISTWRVSDFDLIPDNIGYVLQTYNGEDKDPLTAFRKDPMPIKFADTAEATEERLRNIFGSENFVDAVSMPVDMAA